MHANLQTSTLTKSRVLQHETKLQSHEARVRASQILIIEDDPISTAICVGALKSHGFHNIREACSGKEALSILEIQIPDLIILDLMMSDMDGFYVCQSLKMRPQLKDVPILVYTALEDEPQRLSIFNMGASDLAVKPINQEELVARCRIHLEKRFILKDLQDYRTRMEDDLGHARAMQNMLMPDQDLIDRVQKDYGLEVSSMFSPSLAIGGDFWGVHPLSTGNNRIAFYIGDFTGHGITAAINVFRLCTLIGKVPDELMDSPLQCLLQINQQLHAILPIQLFATMFYGVIDTKNDTLTYCIAGSERPLLLRAEKNILSHSLLEGSGLPLAAVSSPRYKEHTIPFHKGDTLMLYSDALVETDNPAGKHLPIQDIGEALCALPASRRHAEHFLDEVIDQFQTFTAGCPVKDDFTVNFYRRA